MSLKFDPEGAQKLIDFVEEMLHSYKRAFPGETAGDKEIRMIKAAIPEPIQSILNANQEYRGATDARALKSSARRYDQTNRLAGKTTVSKDITKELKSSIQEMIQGLRKEMAESTKAVTAAFQANHAQVDSQRTYRQFSPVRGRSPPGRSESFRGDNNSKYYSTKRDEGRRSPSPSRPQRVPTPSHVQAKQVAFDVPKTNQQTGSEVAFDSQVYWNKRGKPPTPCATCNAWHWYRHCPLNLN